MVGDTNIVICKKRSHFKRFISMRNTSPLRGTPQFHMSAAEQQRLQHLPWQAPLEEWPQHGIVSLSIRRGESRHPVIFVECEGERYAIKETTPRMAEREIRNLREIEFRGIPALSPVGSVTVPAGPIALDEGGRFGKPQYLNADRGYTVTRLAARVIPHALLFNLPLKRRTRQSLLGAVAVLMVELHEHGVYWGDPSLANVLMRIDGRRILAILADAETAELFPGPIEEGLRAQDLELFHESLDWQAEDLRQERGLAEDSQMLGEKDYQFFEQRYRLLRREHARLMSASPALTVLQIERLLDTLGRLGFSMLSISGHALQPFVSVLPGWYARRIRELLGINIPRRYARRFYNTILGHQAILSKKLQRDVGIEEAARDWYTNYHLPAILLLRKVLTSKEDLLGAYFAVMLHKWNLSKKAGYEIPLEEAMMDWAMARAEKGTLGTFDPARIATWWRERKSVAQALEPPLLESEKVEPLLSQQEQGLAHLPVTKLDETLQQRLGPDEEK